jgi:DNA ligase (NAD+)
MLKDTAALERVIKNNETYQNFLDFMFKGREDFNGLEECGLTFQKEQVLGNTFSSTLSGKIFAITGGLLSGSRDVVKKLIEAHGGVVKVNASRHCTHLVVGAGGGRVKAEKSAKYKIPNITEVELYQMMGILMLPASSRDPNHEF